MIIHDGQNDLSIKERKRYSFLRIAVLLTTFVFFIFSIINIRIGQYTIGIIEIFFFLLFLLLYWLLTKKKKLNLVANLSLVLGIILVSILSYFSKAHSSSVWPAITIMFIFIITGKKKGSIYSGIFLLFSIIVFVIKFSIGDNLTPPVATANIISLLIMTYLIHYSNESLKETYENALVQSNERSEKILLNILPFELVEELKTNSKSKPKKYKSVSVMFTDFVGFTNIASNIEAEELVDELDKCFSCFDSISKKFKLEKIKTIGDSYMTCAGIPVANKTHPIDSILAAIEIQSFMNQMKKVKEQQNTPYWELRLGINTGPLIAGVIGEMKFAYDVFGDTVNTASRMESSGVNGKINISKATYELAKDFFDCEYRGKIAAKNKGMIDMYFVNGIKSELSMNDEKRIPNEVFKEKYKKLEEETI